MGKLIESTDVDAIYDAIGTGEISLEDVEARFVDLKTSFQLGTQNMDFNDRNKDKKSCWLELTDAEREQVVEGCSFPALKNPIERWIAYSMHKFQPEFALMRDGELWNHYSIDCDGSKSAEMVPAAINALYRTLWPDVPADSADTMNSFWTTCRRSFEIMGIGKWQVRKGQYEILVEITDESGHLRPEFSETKECYQRSIMRQLLIFAYLTHTIGNFILCDGSFNRDRCRVTDDYWDITLEYIRDWFTRGQDSIVGSPTPDNAFSAETLPECRAWLEYFGKGSGVKGWNAFVKKNYLDAYMQVRSIQGGGYELAKDEMGAYMVQPFYEGHDFSHCLPENPFDIHIELIRMNAAIIARGNQMVTALGDDPCVKLFVK